jgi:D-alanyl-D-alanine carboxypeptidase
MSPNEKTNIASVSKTMTAIAILQLLEKNGLTINDPISPYIYKDWSQGPNISQITFRELLRHRSGFGQSSICGDSYSELQTMVANGVTTGNLGKPSYGNCNFALMRELMPALLGQSPTCFSLFGLPPVCYPYGAQRAEMSSTLYINYMNTNVFQPVGVPASTCKPPVGSTDMLSYPSAGTNSRYRLGRLVANVWRGRLESERESDLQCD